MGSDSYDWLANNYINLGGHTFDGCGNSITINNSWGIVDGVEVEPGYVTTTINNLDYFMKGQSALFKTSSGATIKQLGWHGNAPIGSVVRSSTTSSSLTEWHSTGGLVRDGTIVLNSEGLYKVSNNNLGTLTLQDIYCTRTRQLFCGKEDNGSMFRIYDWNGTSAQTGGLVGSHSNGSDNITIRRCYFKRSYDYNVIKKWGSIMTEQTNIVESCCKQTCCADGCCSDGCNTGECSSSCCSDGCCSDTVNCCTE